MLAHPAKAPGRDDSPLRYPAAPTATTPASGIAAQPNLYPLSHTSSSLANVAGATAGLHTGGAADVVIKPASQSGPSSSRHHSVSVVQHLLSASSQQSPRRTVGYRHDALRTSNPAINPSPSSVSTPREAALSDLLPSASPRAWLPTNSRDDSAGLVPQSPDSTGSILHGVYPPVGLFFITETTLTMEAIGRQWYWFSLQVPEKVC